MAEGYKQRKHGRGQEQDSRGKDRRGKADALGARDTLLIGWQEDGLTLTAFGRRSCPCSSIVGVRDRIWVGVLDGVPPWIDMPMSR